MIIKFLNIIAYEHHRLWILKESCSSFLNISCTSWFCTGECRLENVRTLCVACHADVTAAQCSERRITRADAKRELEAAMKKLDGPQMHDAIDSNLEVSFRKLRF